jgi:phosphoribosylaminoimidazole-succinocarboxamide synthase
MPAQALSATHFELPGQTAFYQGKVRDVYTLGEQLVMVASDRISAFDHILPRAIPYKGQVLNQVALHFLEATRDICPNWLISSPDPNVAVGHACEPFRVEMVIRAHSLWRCLTRRDGGKPALPLPYHHAGDQSRRRPRRGH